MKSTPQIILASRSPRRKKLLKTLNYPFEIYVPEVIEETKSGARETVTYNAMLKAKAAVSQFPEHLIIAADTVVSINNKILEKPTDLDDAFSMLSSLSGQTHQVYTAISIAFKGDITNYCETSSVKFKKLNKKIISLYFEKCNPLDKAGSYNIDENGEMIIEEISGSYENIMGLPLHKIEEILKKITF
jgi:septum formation protein